MIRRVLPTAWLTLLTLTCWFGAASSAIRGSWGWTAVGAIAGGIIAWDAVHHKRGKSDAAAAAELRKAAQRLERDAYYIVRDDRVILVRHWLHKWLPMVQGVTRFQEDDFHQVIEEGSGVISDDSFRFLPFSSEVIHRHDADVLRFTGEEAEYATPRQSRREAFTGTVRLLRMSRAGMLHATAEEMRALTVQIRAAELLVLPDDIPPPGATA